MRASTRIETSSHFRIIRTLIAKDRRFFRVPVMAIVVSGSACILMGVLSECLATSDNLKQHVLQGIFDGTITADALVALLASAIGGIALAGERSDRTSDFVALLPVTRGQIVLSKWLTSIFILGGFFLIYALVALIASFFQYFYLPLPQLLSSWKFAAANWVGCTICFFGVSWLCSAFIRSGPISACVSIGVTLCTVVSTVGVMAGNQYTGAEAAVRIACITGGIGLGSLVMGTAYYLRRISP